MVLGAVHFGIPLAYYWHARTKWLPRPWNIRTDDRYRPMVTVIVPTYNEAERIEARLDNIVAQDYPEGRLKIEVVDSASEDGTVGVVENWASRNDTVAVKLLRECERKGKAKALNEALQHTDSEVIVIADADVLWRENVVSEAIKWLADPTVGGVSCVKSPTKGGPLGLEDAYRRYYNLMRVAESKAFATPIFHGELAAFKRRLIEEVGGFAENIGADDSHMATRLALKGYRTIVPEMLLVEEALPRRGYFWWRVRRAQHLWQHFVKVLRTKHKEPRFRAILFVETYLHIINPWLLLATTSLLLASALEGSILAVTFISVGAILLKLKSFRMWLTNQLCLMVAALRNVKTKEIAWKKEEK